MLYFMDPTIGRLAQDGGKGLYGLYPFEQPSRFWGVLLSQSQIWVQIIRKRSFLQQRLKEDVGFLALDLINVLMNLN